MRPAYVGICGTGKIIRFILRPVVCESCFLHGTDLHEYIGGPLLIPRQPHRITGSAYPVSIGHEFGGIIEEVAEGVTHVTAGQRAVVRPTIFDGTCTPCKQGYNHCCENIGFIGLSGMLQLFNIDYTLIQGSHVQFFQDMVEGCPKRLWHQQAISTQFQTLSH